MQPKVEAPTRGRKTGDGTAGVRLAPAQVLVTELPGGGKLLRSPTALAPYPANICAHLRRWAREAAERVFLAERDPSGAWCRVTYRQTFGQVERLAQGLLDRGLTAQRPVMVLSDNSIHSGLLQLACQYVGIPVAPISPAYSLVSQDHAKLRHVFGVVRPGLVYAAEGKRFARALGALDLAGVEVVVEDDLPAGVRGTIFDDLLASPKAADLEAAYQGVTPDTVAKILFTSGSTDAPKGVIQTQRMLCANQESIAQVWQFLEDRPPVILDWLPWNHVFGGNHNFNMMLRNGGSLYIDRGKPVPGAIETTVANLAEISPTLSFNVPRGYDVLLPYLERDEAVRNSFFRQLDMLFYAAAALPQTLWERLEKLSVEVLGEKVFMASSWGATETAPLITAVHFPIPRAGVIGLPAPGVELKLLPNAGKLEMRVKGPSVTPGYWGRDDLTREAFDEEGFYRIGDAGKLANPEDPTAGIVFDGRISEDFKLTTGTWVQVGAMRLGVIDAAAPVLQDAVVTGHDRDFIGILAWPDLAACRRLAPEAADDPAALCRAPEVVAHLRRTLAAWNRDQKGSSTRVQRVLLLTRPPELDANEITDKGYINQRAVLEHRAGLVAALYAESPTGEVIVL